MEKLNVFSCFLLLAFFISFSQLGAGKKDWCIADPGATDIELSAFLDKVCENGNACKAIKPGKPCFFPPTLKSHASYMLNQLYRKTGFCHKDIGMIFEHDPSYGKCKYY